MNMMSTARAMRLCVITSLIILAAKASTIHTPTLPSTDSSTENDTILPSLIIPTNTLSFGGVLDYDEPTELKETTVSTAGTSSAPVQVEDKSCPRSEFRCEDGQCVGLDRYCNGLLDCLDGSDETPHCSPCNRTYYGEIGRTYELEIRRPSEDQLPFHCHLNFTAAGRTYGELIQISFEAFSVGTFESFTSDGCPDGHVTVREGGSRPPTGGQWCGSAWGYTVYYSETSSVNLTLLLERMPAQSNV